MAKVVTNIPDEELERLVYMDIFKLREYIQNGVVLPKGHGNLKDEDEIYELLNTVNGTAELDKAFEAVEQANTIIKADEGNK